MTGALEGIRVLDFSRVVAGPTATLFLAEMGAEIIKVEMRETGDSVRQIPPFTDAGEGLIYTILNRGKKSITLDPRTEEGRKIAYELLAKSDIVIENYAPGVMKKLGMDYEAFSKVKPDIIFASISGFGQTGPYASKISFDIVAQAMSGLMSLTGYPENPPTKCGPSIGDQAAGMFATIGILAALQYKNKTGEGQYLDISLRDSLFFISAIEFLPIYLDKKELPKRMGNMHELLVPWDLFKTKDGHIIIGCVNNGHWMSLAKVIGREDMAPDAEACTLVNRLKNRDAINAAVAKWAASLTTAEAEAKMDEAGLACSPVLNMAQLVEDPQIKEREMIIEIDQKLSGKMTALGTLFKMSKTPGDPYKPTSFLGENNAEVYGELLGYSDEKIRELMDKQVI